MDATTVAELAADVQEDQTCNEVLEKTTADEPNPENKQYAETMGECEESESKEPDRGI